MQYLYLTFIVIFLIVWLVAGVYITWSTDSIRKVKNDQASDSAYSWSVAAAATTWVIFSLGVIGFILFVIFLFFGGAEIFGAEVAVSSALGQTSKMFHTIVLLTIIIMSFLLFVTGLCSVMTAIDIIKSPSFDPSNKDYNSGYKNAIIAACITFISLGALIFVYLVGVVIHHERVKKMQLDIKKKIAASKVK